ncbi:hypothetical protein INR49_019197 [Caranx melampygus]|nr:hypothetical protein INR49_019197 [Caranx melampygus]
MEGECVTATQQRGDPQLLSSQQLFTLDTWRTCVFTGITGMSQTDLNVLITHHCNKPGGVTRSQEESGGVRRSQEKSQGARRSQEKSGGARRSQMLHVVSSWEHFLRCELARLQFEENMVIEAQHKVSGEEAPCLL